MTTRHRFTRTTIAAAMLGVLLILPGCESKITRENYEKIEVNVTTLDKAKDILGMGGENETSSAGGGITAGGVMSEGRAPDVETWVWEDGGTKIVLTVDDGVVVHKSETGLPEY